MRSASTCRASASRWRPEVHVAPSGREGTGRASTSQGVGDDRSVPVPIPRLDSSGAGLRPRRPLVMSQDHTAASHLEQWLFLITLDSVETTERLVRFYVKEHNERLPHSASKGQARRDVLRERRRRPTSGHRMRKVAGLRGHPRARLRRGRHAVDPGHRGRVSPTREIVRAGRRPGQLSSDWVARPPSEDQLLHGPSARALGTICGFSNARNGRTSCLAFCCLESESA